MTIFTRKMINPSIRYYDCTHEGCKAYDFAELSRLVDAYKNLFLSKGAKKNAKVVIGSQASVSQIAMVMACSELGMTVIIIGTPFSGNRYIPGKINTKLKLMLPIDFFILNSRDETDKFNAFQDTCRFTIVIDEEVLDYTPNNEVVAEPDTVLIQCTTSGTTETPKVIEHTHSFITALITRNSTRFSGSMGMISNLAHGSSLAVYFLPGLVSPGVTTFVNLPHEPLKNTRFDVIRQLDINLEHLLFPYTLQIDELFNSELRMPECTVYTLGLIRKSWVEKVKSGYAKNVVSLFGTNETSGPIFDNQALDDDFSENSYKLIDDFYQVSIDEQNDLTVEVPIYSTVVKTHDLFLKRNDRFVHVGRSNLFRVNDLAVDVAKHQAEIDKISNASLVVDTRQDLIYLAIWDKNTTDQTIKYIDQMLLNDSSGIHRINRYAFLNYDDYLNGIKIDQEMLRQYFRENHT